MAALSVLHLISRKCFASDFTNPKAPAPSPAWSHPETIVLADRCQLLSLQEGETPFTSFCLMLRL